MLWIFLVKTTLSTQSTDFSTGGYFVFDYKMLSPITPCGIELLLLRAVIVMWIKPYFLVGDTVLKLRYNSD